MRIFLTSLIVTFSFMVLGTPDYVESSKSIEWQRIKLEENLKAAIESKLSPIIQSGRYIVTPHIETKNLPRYRSKNSGGGGGGGKKNNKKDENKKKGVQFSDLDYDQVNGEKVLFMKLGLEAPLYGEEDPNAQKKEEKKDPAASAKESIEAWKKSLIDIYDRYDVFRYIKKASIDIKLDQELLPSTRESVQKIFDNTEIKFGKVTTDINVEYIDMKEAYPAPPVEEKPFDWLELLKKFATALGLILSALLLGGFIYFSVKNIIDLLDRFQLRQMVKGSNKNENEGDQEGGSDHHSEDLSQLQDGFERFRKYFSKYPVEAAMLVKKWIKSSRQIEELALNALVDELDSLELSNLFELLHKEDRKAWKSLLQDENLSAEDRDRAAQWIGNEVIQDMIVPPVSLDPEIINVLMELTPEEAAEFVQQEGIYGVILFNMLSARFSAKVLDELPSEIVERTITAGLDLENDDIVNHLSVFSEKIQKYSKSSATHFFLEKIQEIIPMASFEREVSIYHSLAKKGDIHSMDQIAQKYYPSPAVEYLSDKVLKQVFQSLERSERIKLIVTLGKGLKERFIEILAPHGSRAREVMNLEMERFLDNEQELEKLSKQKDELWRGFVTELRGQIKGNDLIRHESKKAIASWCEDFVSETSSSRAA